MRQIQPFIFETFYGMPDFSMAITMLIRHYTYRALVNEYKIYLIIINPPFMIALASTYIASALKYKDTISLFEKVHVDVNIVFIEFLSNHL